MLKFFRRIRRKLLDEGSLRKYLLYAFGEIFLVVIGILIALQINNWNEGRKNINLETKYYQGLISDLEEEKELLHELRNAEIHIRDFATKAQGLLKQGLYQQQIDSLRFFLDQCVPTISFNVIDAAYEDLTATGHLGLFRNKELKDDIIRFYEHCERLEKIIDKNNTWIENQYGGFIRDNQMGFYFDKNGKIASVQLNQPEVRYSLMRQLQSRVSAAIAHSSLMNDLEENLDVLKKEIEKEVGLQ